MKRNHVLHLLTTIITLTIIYCNDDYDPLKVHTYQLDNGLTVYLNEDHNTTSAFGALAIRGGGKRDPEDATGIAHYLEHLLFKGTEEMGTIDYAKEKVYLDSIEVKYNDLGNTTDENERMKIQTDINRLSVQAAKYAIPNEMDRLLEEMGGSWINAFTSNDAIVYLNKFPGNQMEKWLEIYSHRFEAPVFRLFQSELETVYEEKNRSMDNPFGQAFELYSSHFFKNHPYGQQTILGSVEHLKNPSLTKMKEYYNTYYVPNNMALIITGDINLEETLAMVKEKFGGWETRQLPGPIDESEAPFNGREFINNDMTPIKMGSMGYRTVASGHKDELALELAIELLTNNSKTGLIDYLQIEGKMQQVGIYNMRFVDYGGVNFFFFPLQGTQTLDDAETLVKQQIEKLKNGEFDDVFFNAVKVTMIREHEENIENMEGRLFNLVDTYIKDSSWENIIDWPSRLETVTREDIIKVSNKYFGANYLTFHSNEGFPGKHKLEKPPFEPVAPENSEKYSVFANRLNDISEGDLNLKFIEFGDDVKRSKISNKVYLYHTTNPINSIFNLTFQYGVGNFHNPELKQTAELLNLLGTTNYTFNEFKGELQKIGTTISFESNRNYFTINIKGFDKYLAKSIEYLDEFITNVQEEDEKINILLESAKSMRKVENEEPSTIGRAIREFTAFGDKSTYLRRMTIQDIEKSKASDYIESFQEALRYELDILYTGQLNSDVVSKAIKNQLSFSNYPVNSKSPIDREIKNIKKNLIYLVDDSSAVQSQIYFSVNGPRTTDNIRYESEAYHKYFSGGMSSIVFQEIREFRSLAYSAWAYYVRPNRNGKKGYFIGYVGCQTDKTLEAISVFKDITMNMPEKPDRMNQIKSSLIKTINTNRPNFRAYPKTVLDWKKMGYNDDPRKKQVYYFDAMSFDDIINFQEKYIADKPMVINILTDKNRIDMDELREYGEIIILEKKDVLN